MTNRFLISVAAIALIAGASAANAQGNTNREGGAAMQQTPPSTGGNAGGAMPQNSTEPSSGTKSQSEQKQPGAAKSQRAQESAPGQKSKNQATENELKAGPKGNMTTEGREDRDTNMKAEQREGRGDKNLNAEGRDTEHTTTGQAAAGAKLSTEQRTKITTVIRNEHVAPANNVNFSISIGTRVPRERVELRPLPAEVFTVYPEWRGYEFFLVRDEIIVVDPRTLEIVAVLDA